MSLNKIFMKKIFSKITVIVEVVSVLIIVYLIIQFNLKTRNNVRESIINNNNTNNFDNSNDDHVIKEIKNMGLEPALGFCENHRSSGKKSEEACNTLTKKNCSKVGCCAWNNNQCVAGNKFGPLFTTKNGFPLKVETYHHYGKCYGKNC